MKKHKKLKLFYKIFCVILLIISYLMIGIVIIQCINIYFNGYTHEIPKNPSSIYYGFYGTRYGFEGIKYYLKELFSFTYFGIVFVPLYTFCLIYLVIYYKIIKKRLKIKEEN